jgi:hypothetical protein
MEKRYLLTIATILILVLLVPTSALADDSEKKDIPLNPKFIIDEPDYKLIAFSDKVADKHAASKLIEEYTAKLLANMVALEDEAIIDGVRSGLRSGYTSMSDWEESDFGNGYLRSDFETWAAWQSSPAILFGTATGKWYGTSPSYLCARWLD